MQHLQTKSLGQAHKLSTQKKSTLDSSFNSYVQVTDNTLIEAAERILHNIAKPRYQNSRISILKVNRAQTLYIAGLKGEDRSYCLKKGGDHRSNRVFIKIRYDSKYQKYEACMGCPDEECNKLKKWESPARCIAVKEAKRFFPLSFEKKNKNKSIFDTLKADKERVKRQRVDADGGADEHTN